MPCSGNEDAKTWLHGHTLTPHPARPLVILAAACEKPRKAEKPCGAYIFVGAPSGTRTPDPLIKSCKLAILTELSRVAVTGEEH